MFLLASGWAIVLADLRMLRPGSTQGLFGLAGVSVQVVGLVLLFRAHRLSPKERR